LHESAQERRRTYRRRGERLFLAERGVATAEGETMKKKLVECTKTNLRHSASPNFRGAEVWGV